MGNRVLSAFAVAVGIGLGVAVLPRALAPSDSYISDTLNLVEEEKQTVFYEEPITLYYDFSRNDSELCLSVPFFKADISDTSSYNWSFYYFTNGSRRDIYIDFFSPFYPVYFSTLRIFLRMQNVNFMVTAVNLNDSTDVYTWYFQYYFLPFPSSSASTLSLRSLPELSLEELPTEEEQQIEQYEFPIEEQPIKEEDEPPRGEDVENEEQEN